MSSKHKQRKQQRQVTHETEQCWILLGRRSGKTLYLRRVRHTSDHHAAKVTTDWAWAMEREERWKNLNDEETGA